ncbi:large conductance mechanosensitive channel protein MscL [Baekduia sp.]|jgi:large conductance mechanosensitive channel|uniref:large conductance mechanosensitive channel protein MscL n=1 Tax=Baekduia sp. TaxID=2600305 RepID=UPI002DFBD46A|nr:large conductance mechanosensitive channel protein MscL [Baekduia sp.]
MLKDFRQFLLRGNLVDLAIAVVIGAAFGAVVAALVKDIITPLIAAIGGQPDFSGLDFTINKSRFAYGDFLNAILTFVIIAAVVFFFVVKPVNALMERMQTSEPVDEETRECPACLSQIPYAARRCAYCTEEVGSAPPPVASA